MAESVMPRLVMADLITAFSQLEQKGWTVEHLVALGNNTPLCEQVRRQVELYMPQGKHRLPLVSTT